MIELLAVVAIVAVLASLLLPALSRAKNAALSTRCQGNLRQIGFALAMYAGDYGFYPSFVQSLPGSSRLGPTWGTALSVFAGATWTDHLFRCPAYFGLTRIYVPPDGTTIFGDIGSYGLNAQGARGRGLGLSHPSTSVSMVRHPADMIAIGDALLWTNNRVSLINQLF